MKLIFKEIKNTEDFLNLKEQWNQLVKTTDIDHAFMRHEWFESWIKHLKPESELAIQSAWSNNKLVAIVPLHIVKLKRKGIPLRILGFMKSSVTPRCNFIIDKTVDPTIIFDSILSSKGWDVIELKSVECDIELTNNFIEYLDNGQNYVIENGIQSPYEIVDSDWDTYLKSQSKNYKKNMRNYLNRLKKSGSYEILEIENYSDFENHFNALIAISGKSWKALGGTDLKSTLQMAEFFREFCKLGSKDKMFLVHVLIVNKKAIAFSYYIRHNNRLVALRWEYDEEYSYYMPGLVLHNYCLKEICDSGEKWEYDLTGEATAHKARLLNSIRKHIDITIGRPGIKGQAIMLGKKMLMKSNKLND